MTQNNLNWAYCFAMERALKENALGSASVLPGEQSLQIVFGHLEKQYLPLD